jgi:hypothetical protein
MELNPKRGMAKIRDKTIIARKQTRITKIVNMSCGNGFIPRKAVIAIF